MFGCRGCLLGGCVTIPCARSVGSWKVTVMVSSVTLFDTRNLTGMILAAMGGDHLGNYGVHVVGRGGPRGLQGGPLWGHWRICEGYWMSLGRFWGSLRDVSVMLPNVLVATNGG